MGEKEYNKQYDELREKIQALQQEYIDGLPLKKGDKVKVWNSRRPEDARFGVIMNMSSQWNRQNIEYVIAAIKKDGTVGKNNISTWYNDIVEKAD